MDKNWFISERPDGSAQFLTYSELPKSILYSTLLNSLSETNDFKAFENSMFMGSQCGNFHTVTIAILGEKRLSIKVSTLTLLVGSLRKG